MGHIEKPVSTDFVRQLHNFRLTTAEILYHMPDHERLLQSFIWQELDVAPKFPMLKKFLDFWQRELDGKLHSVVICTTGLIKPAEFRAVDGLITLQ